MKNNDINNIINNSNIIILGNYFLTTAHILYHLPDYPEFLQSYVWQEVDLAPEFPTLKRFLGFWQRELDGKLHSVEISAAGMRKRPNISFVDSEIVFH